MNRSFWAHITLSNDQDLPADGLDEDTVKQVCEEIESHVAGVVKASPAEPDTYLGD